MLGQAREQPSGIFASLRKFWRRKWPGTEVILADFAVKELTGEFDENYFRNGFFELMKGKKKLAIRILILDPKKKNEVTFWRKLLKEKNPGVKWDFRDHLRCVIGVFQEWQADADKAGLSLEIKCGDLVVDTANIVDPDGDNGQIFYSRNLQDVIANPLERSWFVSRYGDLDYEPRLASYKGLFDKARSIKDVVL